MRLTETRWIGCCRIDDTIRITVSVVGRCNYIVTIVIVIVIISIIVKTELRLLQEIERTVMIVVSINVICHV